jgi:N-acetylmuramoyl-L-alanine amidase
VLGKNPAGDWLFIEINGLRGWAAGFLFRVSGDINTVPVVDQNGNGAATPVPTPAGAPTAQPTSAPPNPGGMTGVTLSTVRVRSGPGTNYASVGAVDSGLTVTLLARTGTSQWIYIEYQGMRGWVATWLLQITGDVSTLPVLQPVF